MSLTILIIEDDEILRSLTVDAVSLLGFDVIDSISADAALLQLERVPSIALVISDISLPGNLDGLALVKIIWTRSPKLPVILTSGNQSVSQDSMPSHAMFMQKPWTLKMLNSAIRKYLPE